MTDDDPASNAILMRLGLIAPGDEVTVSALPGGVSSLILRIDTPRGPVCLKKALPKLRVASEWHAPVERSLAETAWLKLAGRIAPGSVPKVLGEDRAELAFVMEFLDPARHPVWKNELRDGVIEASFAASVGALLATLHAATAAQPELREQFAHRAQFHALRLEPYFAATAERHPDRRQALQALIDTTGHAGIALMHGDVSPKNILHGPHGPVLLDAECACWGDPAFDLAFCVNHLLLKCAWRPQWTDRYLDSGLSLTRSYLDGVTWEPAAALERRACALLGGLLLARIDGRSPVEYITQDMDKDKIREFARARLLDPDSSVAALTKRWREVWAT